MFFTHAHVMVPKQVGRKPHLPAGLEVWPTQMRPFMKAPVLGATCMARN